MEEAVRERCKAFSANHESDKDRQAYNSTSKHASSVIAKAEAWQATFLSLFPKSDLNQSILFSTVVPLTIFYLFQVVAKAFYGPFSFVLRPDSFSFILRFQCYQDTFLNASQLSLRNTRTDFVLLFNLSLTRL